MLRRTTAAARRIESLMQYTVKYVVNVCINALYRLELSAIVFAPAGWQTGRIRRPIGERLGALTLQPNDWRLTKGLCNLVG
jgi:hypothetical protein